MTSMRLDFGSGSLLNTGAYNTVTIGPLLPGDALDALNIWAIDPSLETSNGIELYCSLWATNGKPRAVSPSAEALLGDVILPEQGIFGVPIVVDPAIPNYHLSWSLRIPLMVKLTDDRLYVTLLRKITAGGTGNVQSFCSLDVFRPTWR